MSRADQTPRIGSDFSTSGRHFRRVNFNNSTLSLPSDPPSYRDDSHDFSGSFQLSEDPRSHEQRLAKYRSLSRPFFFSLPLKAFVALGTRTGSRRNEKLRVVVTRTRVIVVRNYDFYDLQKYARRL